MWLFSRYDHGEYRSTKFYDYYDYQTLLVRPSETSLYIPQVGQNENASHAWYDRTNMIARIDTEKYTSSLTCDVG